MGGSPSPVALRPRLATGLPLIDPVAARRPGAAHGQAHGEDVNATRQRAGNPVSDSGPDARPDGLWRTALHATDIILSATARRPFAMALERGRPICGQFH